MEMTRFLSENLYNEIGRIKEKKLHNGLQSTTFTYNQRGWLKTKTSGQFSELLKYEDGTTPQYNGNISNQNWGFAATTPNVFTYTYDALNRLTNAAATNLSEAITYDDLGNILTMNRNGSSGTYTYDGNRLLQISGALATQPYVYDDNGNMKTDGRNGVVLTYTADGLTKTAVKTGLSMTYQYDSQGNKLERKSNVTGAEVITRYVGGIQYTGSTIDFIQTEEGIARNNGASYSYEYNLTDHLGNVRTSFNRNPSTGAIAVLQKDDYFAFGKRSALQAGPNKYLYNGKELQDGLEMYDYGARFYDPVVGRWNVPDMLAELAPNLSPFRYCFNNPVNDTDPYGLWEITANCYSTDKKEDIERFLNMMQIENHSLKNNPNISQISNFIAGEMKTGGLGALSDGSKLADGFTVNQQRDFSGGKHWVTDQKSYNNFWHSVQGDLTPDALDARTIGNNLPGLTYTGSDNPKKYNGDDDYSYRPSIYDKPGYIHDLAYRDLAASGLNGLFNEKSAIKADYTFVAQNLAIAYNPTINPILRARAYLLGVVLGLIALPKTIENYMPTMVNPPSR